MRKYEFRGQRVSDKMWIYGYYIYKNWEGGNNKHYIISFNNGIEFEVIPETVGQFTGLKDKNGVKIFEGDILKEGNQIILVLWDNEYASFTLHCENWSCLGFFYEDIAVDKVEVIGNIHDNPEQFNIK